MSDPGVWGWALDASRTTHDNSLSPSSVSLIILPRLIFSTSLHALFQGNPSLSAYTERSSPSPQIRDAPGPR